MQENYNHIAGVIEDKKLNDGTNAEYQMEVIALDVLNHRQVDV